MLEITNQRLVGVSPTDEKTQDEFKNTKILNVSTPICSIFGIYDEKSDHFRIIGYDKLSQILDLNRVYPSSYPKF